MERNAFHWSLEARYLAVVLIVRLAKLRYKLDAEMARIATRLLMLCDALDKVVQDQTAMEAAGQEFKNLLETVSSE